MGIGATCRMEPLIGRLAVCLFAGAALLLAQTNAYVGSKACSGCHAAIYRSYKDTAMGRSLAPASDWSADVLPAAATVTQPGTNHAFRVFHDPSGWHQSDSEAGVFSAEYPLAYAVGSGTNGITFLLRRGNFLFQAPLSYYSKAHKWDLSPGYEQVDLGFSRAVPEECINCHAGRPSPVPQGAGAFENPPFQELAIGCENCHGPGANHVKSGGKAAFIVNPGKLDRRLAENICLNCHQTGDTRILQPGKQFDDFRPGEWLFDTVAVVNAPPNAGAENSDLLQHFSAMQASRCFRESAGKLSCLTCHNPHVQPKGAAAVVFYRARCLTCHSETSCTVPREKRMAQTPADDCAGCHMPKRNVLEVEHSALTNHRIPARPSEQIAPPRQIESAGLVILDPPGTNSVALSNITLLQAYGELLNRYPEYRDRYSAVLTTLGRESAPSPIAQQALGHQSLLDGQLEAAVAHLTAALPLQQPAVYLELAEALSKLGRAEEAIQYLKTGITLAPFDPVMRKTLILQYINSKAYAEARQQLEDYVSLFPEDSFMRSMLQRVSR